MSEPWTICHGCMRPIAVTVFPAEEGLGAWWSATCPDRKCDRTTEPAGLLQNDAADFPPPTALDNLAQILPILARVADDDSAPATVRAAVSKLLTAANDAMPAPADPNQIPLPLGAP